MWCESKHLSQFSPSNQRLLRRNKRKETTVRSLSGGQGNKSGPFISHFSTLKCPVSPKLRQYTRLIRVQPIVVRHTERKSINLRSSKNMFKLTVLLANLTEHSGVSEAPLPSSVETLFGHDVTSFKYVYSDIDKKNYNMSFKFGQNTTMFW